MMSYLRSAACAFVITLCGLPAFAADAWETIAPGGETSCALGTPYTFHARRGDPEKVVVFFNGGGACWAGQTCDPTVEPTTYVPSAQMGHNDPRTHKGIFDLGNPANPVGGWSMVFVSYCTGDVHLGGIDRTYTKPDGSEITIRHRGHANAHAALNWMKENFGDAKEILVSGSSAGAVASPIYAGVVAKTHPDATVRHLGDGAGGYGAENVNTTLDAWDLSNSLPDWAIGQNMEKGFTGLYLNAIAAFPDIAFAQYDAAHDRVQVQFSQALGGSSELLPQLTENHETISAATESFRSYTAGGAEHTVLRAPYLYSYSVGGMSFVEWLSDLATGEKPASVSCTEHDDGCDNAPS
jgi:pectinacetylesterase